MYSLTWLFVCVMYTMIVFYVEACGSESVMCACTCTMCTCGHTRRVWAESLASRLRSSDVWHACWRTGDKCACSCRCDCVNVCVLRCECLRVSVYVNVCAYMYQVCFFLCACFLSTEILLPCAHLRHMFIDSTLLWTCCTGGSLSLRPQAVL